MPLVLKEIEARTEDSQVKQETFLDAYFFMLQFLIKFGPFTSLSSLYRRNQIFRFSQKEKQNYHYHDNLFIAS